MSHISYLIKLIIQIFNVYVFSDGSKSHELLLKYGFEESQKLSHRSFFLTKILSCHSILDYLQAEKLTSCVIKTWLSYCVWFLNDAVSFTQSLLQLPTFVKYIVNKQCHDGTDVLSILFQFLSGVGKYYNNLDTVVEMVEVRKFLENCFSDFVKDAEQLLANNESVSSAVRTSYEICGKLVKYCEKIVYKKV